MAIISLLSYYNMVMMLAHGYSSIRIKSKLLPLEVNRMKLMERLLHCLDKINRKKLFEQTCLVSQRTKSNYILCEMEP